VDLKHSESKMAIAANPKHITKGMYGFISYKNPAAIKLMADRVEKSPRPFPRIFEYIFPCAVAFWN